MTHPKQLTVGHSPDADDAFMFFGIERKAATIPGYEVVHVMQDIQTLNRRALEGELDVTAISTAVYPQVASSYAILACGASMGRKYGPLVVAAAPMEPAGLNGKRVAVPGRETTAYMLARFYLPAFEPVFTDFDAIGQAVLGRDVDAGIIIHEGQLTYQEEGLHKVLDLGQAWFDDTGLPIPLGLDVVHRRLGPEMHRAVYELLHTSIIYADSHEDDALQYALGFGRGVDELRGRTFVRMYVNEDTLDMGAEGLRALETLFRRARDAGLIDAAPPLDIVGPGRG